MTVTTSSTALGAANVHTTTTMMNNVLSKMLAFLGHPETRQILTMVKDKIDFTIDIGTSFRICRACHQGRLAISIAWRGYSEK